MRTRKWEGRILGGLRFFLSALRDFVFPPVCLGCDKTEVDSGQICPSCLTALRTFTEPAPLRHGPELVHVRALGRYAPPHSSLVHELKYRSRKSVARLLSEPLAGMVFSDALLARADLLVPVPLHPARQRERGYNQSQLLAAEVATRTGMPTQEALRRVRNTRAQIRLDDAARRRNMEGAFAPRPGASVAGKTVILVDDVTTTGATLSAAAQALKDAGAGRVYALVVCRAKA